MTIQPNITFKPVDPPHGTSVTAQLGDGFATPTADGGWAVVARPRQLGYTDWQGTTPVSMDIPIMLDGFRSNSSVEGSISRLFQMMMQRVGTRNEPVVIEILGVPLPFHGYRWVINSISPDDEVRRNTDGHRIRASMSITVQQYVSGDVLIHRKPSPAKKHKGGHGGSRTKPTHTHTKIYTVRRGDTLSKIAAKELGKSSKWPEIAKLNHLRDPDNIKVGQKLKIPAK
jgi:hypothetical protein